MDRFNPQQEQNAAWQAPGTSRRNVPMFTPASRREAASSQPQREFNSERNVPVFRPRETVRQEPVLQEPPRTTLEDMRRKWRERDEAALAPLVASEKAKLQAEFSGMSYRDKIGLLSRKERDLASEERLANDPINRAAFEGYWPKPPNHTEEAWEQSVKARKQAYKEIRDGFGS